MIRQLRHVGTNMLPLGQSSEFQFARRHALCAYRSESIYTFIPKNACSTMRLSLARANGIPISDDTFSWIHPNNGTFVADLNALAKAKFTFVILRDPFARLASVYLDKIVERYPPFWDLHARHLAPPDTFTFKTFVKLICSPGFLRLNIHWRPQIDFLAYDDYDLWVRLEDFNQYKDQIEDHGGFTIYDARGLTQHGTDQYDTITDGKFADVPPDEIRAMRKEGRCPSHDSLYNDELRAIVRKHYHLDFEIYRQKFGEISQD